MVAVTYGSARVAGAASHTRTPAKPTNFFARLMTAMMDARLRQAHRELELHQHLMQGWEREIDPAGRKDLPFGR